MVPEVQSCSKTPDRQERAGPRWGGIVPGEEDRSQFRYSRPCPCVPMAAGQPSGYSVGERRDEPLRALRVLQTRLARTGQGYLVASVSSHLDRRLCKEGHDDADSQSAASNAF